MSHTVGSGALAAALGEQPDAPSSPAVLATAANPRVRPCRAMRLRKHANLVGGCLP